MITVTGKYKGKDTTVHWGDGIVIAPDAFSAELDALFAQPIHDLSSLIELRLPWRLDETESGLLIESMFDELASSGFNLGEWRDNDLVKAEPRSVSKHMGPGPHPSGSPQSAHAGSRISPFNRSLTGTENTMAAVKAVDPILPGKVIANWERLGKASRRTIRARYIRLMEKAQESGTFEKGKTWYFDQHNDLTDLSAKYKQWNVETFAAATAALSPQTEWTDNLRYVEEMAEFLKKGTVHGLNAEDLVVLNDHLRDIGGGDTVVIDGMKFSKMSSREAAMTMFAMTKDFEESWGTGTGFTPFADAIEIFGGSSPDILGGVKTRSFYNVLWDPANTQDVTIDFQMMNAAGNQIFSDNTISRMNSTPSKKIRGSPFDSTDIGVRPYLADIVRSVATKFDVSPSQAQAIIWIQWKRIRPDLRSTG